MAQKSGLHQLRLVDDPTIIYQVPFYPRWLFGMSEPSTVMAEYDHLSLNLKIDDKSEMEIVFTSGKKSNVSYIFSSQNVP